MIRFGSMSITLLVAACYGLLFVCLLWTGPGNRIANRFLAALVVVIVLRLVPYIIGYAGFYDAWPQLSYMPYNLSFAIGPLLWCHVVSLTAGAAPRRFMWHLLPAMLQFIYYIVVFVQPLEFKNTWDEDTHIPWIGPVEMTFTFVSMAGYWWFSWRHLRDYRNWLDGHQSQSEEHRIDWLRHFLIALAVTLVLWVAIVLFHRLVAPLDYFQQFPYYVWLSVLVYYLGTEGYRHARHRFPVPEEAEPEPEPVAPAAEPSRSAIDWVQRGQDWRDRIVANAWWRDPELSLTRLARLLGTNTGDLSRGINEGLGMNLNELINRLRVEAVLAGLASDPDTGLLDLALASGFSSKASFNRSFKRFTGETPSEAATRLRASR